MVPTWAISLWSEQGWTASSDSSTAADHGLIDTALQSPWDSCRRPRTSGPRATSPGPAPWQWWCRHRRHQRSWRQPLSPSAHPCSHTCLQLDFLGHGDTVFGHGRGTEGLIQHHVAALGTERDLDRVGQDIDARSMRARAASRNLTSLAAICSSLLLKFVSIYGTG